MQENSLIVIFDDDCLMCNSFILKIISKDQKEGIKFTSLNSNSSKKIISEKRIKLPKGETIIFISKDKYYFKSTAIIEIYKSVGAWHFLILYIIPKTLRDIVYDVVAKHRKKIQSSKVCAIMPASKKKLFF